MQQEDYLLREIEKIGAILIAIRQKLFGGKSKVSISVNQQIEDAKGQLISEINFDLDKFLNLSIDDSNEYILSFTGFTVENIELLAKYLSEIGFSDESGNSGKFLEKALQLYTLCNYKSSTYSMERESAILAIKNAI